MSTDACETLAQAGVLSARLVGNRYYYALANRRGLAEFVGTVPDIAPDWNALFHVVKTIHRVSELASELSHQALVVEAHEAARDIEDDIEILGIRGACRRRGEEFLDEWRRWADEVMSDLASGSWPGVEGDAQRHVVRATRSPARDIKLGAGRRASVGCADYVRRRSDPYSTPRLCCAPSWGSCG